MIMSRVYIAMAVAGLLGGVGWYAKAQTERAAGAEAKIESMIAALAVQQARVDDLNAEVARTEAARQIAADGLSEWRRRYNRSKRDDQSLADYVAIPLPRAASDLMCQYARCDRVPESSAPAGASPDLRP